ncbi:hypothetical protein GWK47_002486 [Chionoecetes opilio]|uniref:Uncharacterized protein n=1 Tax=Chionoecetes opilio TaxID=41210 RepID=A0A8J4XMV4_CHIOP|nr:hypothetical protein GWK47_002486 [Chionoecetes opilio]
MASNHPHKTRRSVASHRLSPDVTAAPTPAPHPDKTPARPSSSKRAAATRASTSAASTNADCPEPFKDNITASALNHPQRSKHLHQLVASSSAALQPASPVPHCSTQTPQRSSHSFHFRGPTPDVRKGAGTRHCHLRGHVNTHSRYSHGCSRSRVGPRAPLPDKIASNILDRFPHVSTLAALEWYHGLNELRTTDLESRPQDREGIKFVTNHVGLASVV